MPHSVRLAAAQAYIEYVADLLDSSTVDRQVEGSVAKLFATESGNLAADAAVGALGGYGYCVDYEVEKIRRDARILTIYEGTSEIQQNIIGVFRIRDNVRSKGKFYETLAAEVEGMTEVGGPAAARTARFLSEATIRAFRAKLTHQQFAVFEFATSMTEVETAVALVRAASRSDNALLKAQARIWASEIALSVPTRLLSVLSSSGGLSTDDFETLKVLGNLDGALALQAGRFADLDFIAKTITAD